MISRFIRTVRRLRLLFLGRRFLFKNTERVFTQIYHSNVWQGRESVSGTGSDSVETSILIERLPELFGKLEVQTVLDVPCGDFNWMKDAIPAGVDYIGGDIVKELIAENSRRFGNESTKFTTIDITSDDLPTVDLVFCRDCLVHLSIPLIWKAIDQIVASKSRYLMMTTFHGVEENYNIVTGSWRALDFTKPPFSFPSPLLELDECYGRLTGDTRFLKFMAVWRISDIDDHLVCTKTAK